MSASADDPISINCVSLEVTYKDSLQAESGSTASDISERGSHASNHSIFQLNQAKTSFAFLIADCFSTTDEVQDISKKSELDCAVYKEDHLFEQLLEDYIYDFEDASEKLMSPLDTLETCPGNNDSSFAIERKKTNEELMSQGELAQHCRMLDLPKEGCEHEKGTSQKASWELLTQQAMLVKEQVVDTSGVPNQEEKLVVMRESLLDCIVRDSPIKEVSSFLTQPTGASLKTNACFADDDLFKQDGSDATEKIVNLEGNKVDMGQRTESATKDFQDIGLTVSPDLLDENLDYIRTQMKSNKHLKERLKSNLAHCINKKKVIDSTSPPETIEIMSKENCGAEENTLYLQSEKPFTIAEKRRQGDMGDRSIFPSHTRRCLSPYESSLKLSETNTLEFRSKQLRLQEGDMDFNRAISIVEQDQMKQCTHFMDLQYNNIFLEKKVKEMEKKLLQEGDMGLNKIIKGLVQDQKKQQTQIMDLYYDNVSLKTKIKQLEMDVVKQHYDTEAIKERNTTDLMEVKNKVTEEKDEAKNCLKNTHDVSVSTADNLQDTGSEKSNLTLQLENLKADCEILQEKYQAEVEEKKKYMNRCAELESILHKKEQELNELDHLKQKLEHELSDTVSSLHKIQEAKDDTEKRLVSLQAELQRQNDERLAEREEMGCRYSKLVAQIKNLQVESENEQAETEKMQQQIYAFKMENNELQQQIGKSKVQTQFVQQEAARWKQQYGQIRESQSLKEQMQYQMIQVLRHKIGLQQKELRKKENIIEWKMHILGRFLLDMKSMNSDLSFRSLHTDEEHFNAPYVQKASNLLSKIRSLVALTEGLLTCQDTDSKSLAECSKKRETVIELKKKMKHLSLKKKTVEKELQKQKNNIAAIRELIINGKSPEDHASDSAYSNQLSGFQRIDMGAPCDTDRQNCSDGIVEDRLLQDDDQNRFNTIDSENDQEESDNGTDLPNLLKTKLDEYHKQSDELHTAVRKMRDKGHNPTYVYSEVKELESNLISKEEACKKVIGENDQLQNDLGSLTCKVKSYEEIIECADQRLEQASSKISYLEKRNKNLEDIIKKFRKKVRTLRQKMSSFFPKAQIQEDAQGPSGSNLDD